MERRGSAEAGRFSTIRKKQFLMVGEQDQGRNSRRTTGRTGGGSGECSRNAHLAGALPIKRSNKAAILTKPGALEEKLTFLTKPRAKASAPDNEESSRVAPTSSESRKFNACRTNVGRGDAAPDTLSDPVNSLTPPSPLPLRAKRYHLAG